MAFELVLDASVSLAWVIRERDASRAAYAEAIARLAAGDAVLHVPIHWGIEMGHVLRRELNAGTLGRRAIQRAFDDLDQIDIRSHTEHYSARQVFELAGRYNLQGYDALYFELARALKLPLATLDHGHIQAARQKHGVTRFVPDVDESVE